MSMLNGVDLALLSFLGVNGRAFDAIGRESDPRDLIAASSRRAKRRLDNVELAQKLEIAQSHRESLLDFEASGGIIVGQGGPKELGDLVRAPSPPLCAFLRGDPDLLLAKPKVAIIGTRAPSSRGIQRATEIAANLAKQGILVISGGAIGIDFAAHEGAMSVDAPTLAVLGDPLKAGRDERPQRLLTLRPKHLLTTVTMFGPWVPANRSLFVARNQYVAALADAVVIIEGRPNSGTLHTARYAKEMGVPVWVIPGDPHDEMSQAANALLEQGSARALVRLEYFLSTLSVDRAKKRSSPIQQSFIEEPIETENRPQLSMAQDRLIELLKKNGKRLTVDELAEKCETPIYVLQQELLMLELVGAVRREGMEFVVSSSRMQNLYH